MQISKTQPRIAVLIKQVPARPGAEMDSCGTVRRMAGQGILNPYDYAAIEAALFTARALGGTVTAFSMGPSGAEQVLLGSLALGVSEAVLLCDSAFAGADVFATAFTLSRAIRLAGGFDYIFCGQQTTDGDTAQLPFSLAAQLGISAFGWVKKLIRADELLLECTQEYSGGTRQIRANAPCVLAMQRDSFPVRQATLAQRLQAAGQKVTVWGLVELGEGAHYGLRGSPTRVKRLFQAVQTRRKEPLRLSPGDAACCICDTVKAVREGSAQLQRVRALQSGLPQTRICEVVLKEASPCPPYNAQEAGRDILVFLQTDEKGMIHPASLELAAQAAELAKRANVQAIGCVAVLAANQRLHKMRENGGISPMNGLRLTLAHQLQASGLAQTDVCLLQGVLSSAVPEEAWLAAALACCANRHPGSFLVAATLEGRALAPALGAKLQTGVTADCTSLSLLPDGTLLQTRPALGGSTMAEIVTPSARPQIATVRRGALEGSVTPQGTDSNTIFLAVGGGFQSKDDVLRLQTFAKEQGFHFGCSRALVERGWLPQSCQIGLSGQSIAPSLLLCFGISGSVQFLAGIHAAKHVLAVNLDEHAPILCRADIPIVSDCNAILQALFR